ncbi:hypothetical protein B0H65DRAFT_538357 [Neurospora tetraspora]|uniref:Uncharacterized protein n=1 Tax=Neurospora tetraspora TaxID=94610 RepID=A0AAE0MSH1_9PEZI|nr:hypothetical protein B0H65DRAFT_538357 [Neurospora tetraspora]
MARTKYTTRSATATKARGQKLEEVAVDNAKVAIAEENVAADEDESWLLLPEPVSATIAKPADKVTPNAITPGKTAVKAKKIILHLPPARVLHHLQILPVDVIISDMTDANGGIPPSSAEILAEAVKWFKHAYRTGTSPAVVRSAAQTILERLDTVIKGNPAYMHNIPRGMAYERLELQRKFLRAIIQIHCGMLGSLEVFDMIVARD